ncbi:MAG: class I SAM-dependent methyltransferase [Acidobacteriia bacterium]|nr:class I SAM-dependent methyltransferase [Terriglobia bacterium]
MARLPMAIPSSLEVLTQDVPGRVLNEAFRLACERLDRFIGALAIETAAGLGLRAGDLAPLDRLAAERGWQVAGALSLQWLFETLELYGEAERRGDGWRLECVAPPVSSAQLRAEAERAVPTARPAYEVMALSAHALQGVLQGDLRGEDALFGPATMGLWFDYFSNANPHYAPNNQLTALAVERAIGPRACVLEVGGGGGSAALALFDALAQAHKPPSSYVFTELQPAFLRRGVRAIQPVLPEGCGMRSLRYDIDGDPGAQGVEAGQFDVVFGVNTLHLAREVVGTLQKLRTLLRPGGVLVVGELLRPTSTAAVHLELPFTLLMTYGQVPPEEGIRVRPGFMSARGWRRALETAGFDEITVLPAEIERCAEIYPGFYCGAITARA